MKSDWQIKAGWKEENSVLCQTCILTKGQSFLHRFNESYVAAGKKTGYTDRKVPE